MIAGRRHHEQPQARPGRPGIDLLDDVERIGDVGAAPAGARTGDLEVAPGRRAPPAHPDAGRLHVEAAPGLMLGQDAGDVVIDDDHLIDMRPCHCLANMPTVAEPQPTRMRVSSTPSMMGAVPALTIDRRAAIDGELDRLAVAQRQHACRR